MDSAGPSSSWQQANQLRRRLKPVVRPSSPLPEESESSDTTDGARPIWGATASLASAARSAACRSARSRPQASPTRAMTMPRWRPGVGEIGAPPAAHRAMACATASRSEAAPAALVTARRSATPMNPSPVGRSRPRNAARKGSASSSPGRGRAMSASAIHSAQSMAPLASRSMAWASCSSLSSGTRLSDPSSALMPEANSRTQMRPSPSASKAKNNSCIGSADSPASSSASAVSRAHNTRSSCCTKSRRAKWQTKARAVREWRAKLDA
mmetsp:Transcript_125528/g.363222  ORF Transcript_125528/g.363222 Transcript_125528/m.363222 type:complete len:268 (-) Transcript_125528:1320-2123(-)